MAKILIIKYEQIDPMNDPDVMQIHCILQIQETGEAYLQYEFDPAVELKVLGVYRTALGMNQEIKEQAEDWLYSNYAISGFNKIYTVGAIDIV